MDEQLTPRVDRIAILALSVEWVFFGSLHFALPGLTVKQIPDWISYQPFIAVVTGMLEVATGILILLPTARKWATWGSIGLLFLFLPAIYNMLVCHEASPASGAWTIVWRLLLVPNHVFLALCAIHLLRSKGASTIGGAHALERIMAPQQRAITPQLAPTTGAATLIVAWVMLLANAAGFLTIWTSPWYHTTASLWAMMCLAMGALVGFLFGVPRVNSESAQSSTHSPNSNIMVVSDWLTKIIVGVGLLEFNSIRAFVSKLAADLGESLPPKPGTQTEFPATSFAQALIVYFFITGIIQGYLLTRMYIGRKFEELEAREPQAGNTTSPRRKSHTGGRTKPPDESPARDK